MWRLVGLVLALLVSVSAMTPQVTRALPLGSAQRDALRQLAEPISDCIARHDTPSPAFHGCYDWHSAVHANLAVRIIGRLTGQPAYREVAEAIAGAEAIAAEHAHLGDGALLEELPYGYAWLLLLDVEATHPAIHAMASDAATDVRAWLRANLDDPGHLLATRYASSTFPAYALHRWYARFAPRRARTFAQHAAERLLPQHDAACASAVARPGFLDPCASLLLALSQMAADAGVARTTLARLSAIVAARPVVRTAELRAIFEAGLNFSRAWALYAAADATQDETLVERGDRLFNAQLRQPEMWREGYEDYSHWVAQFGVYALQLRSEIDGSGGAPIPLPHPGPDPLPIPFSTPGRHLPTAMRPI